MTQSIGPFSTYSPPGVYVQTLSNPVLNQVLGGLRVPVLIGVAQQSLTQTNFELIRGSSSVADTPVYGEDPTGQFIINGTNSQPILGSANGTVSNFRVRNYPIVDGAGVGRVTYDTTKVSVTVNGNQAVVTAVDGQNGVISLLIPPKATDIVAVNYYFHRGDTRITDNLSAQVTTTPGILVAPKAETYNIIAGINDMLILTTDDSNLVTIKLTSGATRAAADVAQDINAAAVTDLVASIHIDNQGLNHVQIVSQGNILVGSGTANGALGFNPGQYTSRKKTFTVFNGPIVDGSGGGITTTEPSRVTVMVNGQQVLASSVDGLNQTVTLPFAPKPSSTVAITYYFNTWQDTFDYLPNSNVLSVTNCGIGPGRTDFNQGPDFVTVNNGEQSTIQWGTAFTVAAGVTTGTANFDSTVINGLLVDNRIFGVPLTRFTDPTTNSVSTTVFTLPLSPTTGNGRDTPLGQSLYQTITNGRIDLPTNRPDLVVVYVGTSWRDAFAHPPVQVQSVDSATNLVTLSNPVPSSYQAFATFWYNTIGENVFTLSVQTSGPSGVGQYTVQSQATGALLYNVTFGTVSGLSTQIQWPSGVQNEPDAFMTGAGSPVAETVTVTFLDSLDPSYGASFTNTNSDPYDLYTYSQNFGGIVIDGNTPITVNLGTAFPAVTLGQPFTNPLALVFRSTDFISLNIDGVNIAAVSMSGLTTAAQVVSALNTAIDADVQSHKDGSGTFSSTAPNHLVSVTSFAGGADAIIQIKGRNVKSSITSGLISNATVITPVGAGSTNGAPVVGLQSNLSSSGSFNALDQPAQLIAATTAPYNITTGLNDNLQLNVDGSTFGVTLPSGPSVALVDVVTAINDSYLSVASPADIAAQTASLVLVVNDLKNKFNTHIASAYNTGYHLVADTVNSVVVGNASDLPSSITLVNAIASSYNAHLTEATLEGVSISTITNSGGLFEITTSAANSLSTNNLVRIQGVVGVPQVNNTWLVTVVDTTHFTLQGSSFTTGYTSGGTVELAVHQVDDSINGEVLPVATNLQTAITLAHDLQEKYDAHLTQADVHGYNDSINIESLTNIGATISGAVSSAGLIEIITSATNSFVTGQTVTISGVLGTTEANGTWVIVVVDSTHFTLDGSTFTNAYVSGGTVQDQTTIQALLNGLKTQINAHFAQSDVHQVSDTVNTISAANASDSTTPWTTTAALANAIKASLNAHFSQAVTGVNVHPVNDVTNIITTANATTTGTIGFASIVALANAIGYSTTFGAYNAHRTQLEGTSHVHGTFDKVNETTVTLTTLVATAGVGQYAGQLVLTSRTNTPVSQLAVLQSSTAATALGFTSGISANRVQPTAINIATALNNNTGFGLLAVAYGIAVPGLGNFLELNSRSVGSTSTLAFTNIANSAFTSDAGLGITPGVSGGIGENALAGYQVSSSAGILGSHGFGVPGQTYTDATTGLRFTVLPASVSAGYDNGGSFTMSVNTIFTCDASIASNALSGMQVLVYNTLNMTPGTTGVISTYPHKGFQPSIGDVYYISYQYGKTDLSPALFRDLKSIQTNFGTPTPAYPLSLAASLALLNGAVIVGLEQVLAVPGQSQASDASYTAAIDTLRSPIQGTVNADIITPLTTDPIVFTYLNQHCIFMSSPRQEGERMGVVGVAVGTTPTGVSTIAQGLASELMVVVYPDSFVITVTDASNNSSEQLIDGSFCAAALAGSTCNPAIDVATPITRRQILGFTALGTVLDPTTANQVAVGGVTIIDQITSGLRVRQGLTTNLATVITRTPSVTLTIQYVQQTLRNTLDPFIGNKLVNSTISNINNQVTGMFGQLIDAQIVQSVSGISVATSPTDPTVVLVEAIYVPVFPLEYVVATLQIRVSM